MVIWENASWALVRGELDPVPEGYVVRWSDDDYTLYRKPAE